MPIEFYSPNRSIKGGTLYASFNSKEGCVYFKLVAQTSWDDKTKRGGFKGGKNINVKFSQEEVGAILYCARNKTSTKFYHTHPTTGNCSGEFKYYVIKNEDGSISKDGFGLVVRKQETAEQGGNSIEIKIGFTLGGAERLAQYLEFALSHIFTAIYSKDKKEAEDYFKNKKPKVEEEIEEEQETEEVEKEDTSDF